MRTIPKKAKKRKPVLYALEPISNEGIEDPENGPLKTEGPYVVEGELLGSIVVSVPETTSHKAARDLSDQLTAHYGKEVTVVTHNISFVRLQRVTKKEAVKISERVMDKAGDRFRYDRYEVFKTKDGDVEGHTVQVGQKEWVRLEKDFGPSIFDDLCVTADNATMEWVVERMMDDGWVELGRFPARVEEDTGEAGDG